jgi:hypothetical protein
LTPPGNQAASRDPKLQAKGRRLNEMERNKGFTYHGFTFADMLFEELG